MGSGNWVIIFEGEKDTGNKYVDLDSVYLIGINENYLKEHRVENLSEEKFYIASFKLKEEKFPFCDFSVFFINGKPSKFGFFFNYLSFSINGQLYLAFIHRITPYSGNWDKDLCIYRDSKLEFLIQDYSFAD